jgi:hypothetical protein
LEQTVDVSRRNIIAMSPLPSEFVLLQRAVAGRYSLDRELGRGGMGIVFLARDVALERPVAIKLLPPALAAVTGFKDRFVREARTAAALSHPHIVPIHAVEQAGDLVFFVMEYVPGETLGARVRRGGPFGATEGTRILREIAWALSHAHGRGVIHRDIKPDNILLEAGTGRTLVTDLGIAHAEGSVVSGASGTPHYVAPELLAGGTPSAASDLYALGVTAWVLFTGRRPFEGMDGAALVAQQSATATPSLSGAAPRLPVVLTAAIDRCLAREPHDRWSAAEEFARALSESESARSAIPAPLRRFVAEGRSLTEQAVFGLTGAVAAEVGLLALFGWDDFAGVVFHPIALLLGGFALGRLWEVAGQARALLRQGWGQGAAIAAAKVEAIDDATTDGDARTLRSVLITGAMQTAGAVVALRWFEDSTAISLVAAAAMILIPALTAMRAWRVRSPTGSSIWSRLLGGRAGSWLFRIAGLRQAPRAGAPIPGEPTALALGGSIEGLYDALPAEQRKRLAEVPDLAARLQACALSAGAGRIEAVAALETLRLDILRLQAGTITEPELTADLDAVRKMGEEIDRVVAANAEVRKVVG